MDAKTLRKSQFTDGTFELQFFGEGLFGLKKLEGDKEWTWRGKYSTDSATKTLTLLPSHAATPELHKSKKLKNKGEEKWELVANDGVTEFSGLLAGSQTTLKLKEVTQEDDDLGF